jgi:hypothetical protein
MLETTDPWQELSEGEAIGVIDRFALQHRLPNGKTVLDQFLAGRPDLTAADREMLRGWRHPVEGIFEIHRKDRDALVLLNLIDDLEYRMAAAARPWSGLVVVVAVNVAVSSGKSSDGLLRALTSIAERLSVTCKRFVDALHWTLDVEAAVALWPIAWLLADAWSQASVISFGSPLPADCGVPLLKPAHR